MPLTPFVVDAVDVAGCRQVYTTIAPFGPISIPGGLLHFLWSATANTLLACHSVDGGQTWSVLDSLNSPAAPNSAIPGYVDVAANRVVLIASDAGTSVLIHVFDLTTLTWQAPFAGTNPPIVDPVKLYGFFQRSDGTRVLLYAKLPHGFDPTQAVVLSLGNVWAAPFSINTNADALYGGFPTGVVVATLDATDTLHVFMSMGAWPFAQFYQAVLSTNALGAFATLPTALTGIYFGVPVVVGANIIVPTVLASDGSPTSVWVGTPLGAPVWTESAGIFPNANTAGFTSAITLPPFCSYDGTSLVCAKILNGPGVLTQNIISISQASDPSNPLAAWSDSIVWQGLPADLIYGELVSSPQIGNAGIVAVDCLVNNLNYVFLAPPPPLVRLISGSPGGGGKAFRPPTCERCCPPLLAEAVLWNRGKRALELDAPPRGSKHVFVSGSLLAPATNAQTLIVQYQVPNGFRFRLKGLLLDCNCPGWTPGDGNAVFSLSLNKPVGSAAAQGAPVRGFENVNVALGSFNYGPWPIPEDERSLFESRDVVRILVVSNPLVIAPGLPNVFMAMLMGYIWPLSSEPAGGML